MNTMERIAGTSTVRSPRVSKLPDVQDFLDHVRGRVYAAFYIPLPLLSQDQGIQDPSRSKPMSTHDEIFTAMQDAIEAYRREPSLEKDLTKARDDRDFAELELSEARSAIDRLRATVCKLEDEVSARVAQIGDLANEVSLLMSAKDAIHSKFLVADRTIADMSLTINELRDRVHILSADKSALLLRLEDAKGYGTRLAEMLKGFGSAIQSAVAEPAVSADAPFPTPNPVGMSVSASLTDIAPSLDEVSTDRVSPVDLAPAERVEPVTDQNSAEREHADVMEKAKLQSESGSDLAKGCPEDFNQPWWNR